MQVKGTYEDVVPKSARLMDTVASWIRSGRKKSKERRKLEGDKKTSKRDEIVPDGSASGFAPGRLGRFMAYA